jgi:hypothetical protein
MPELHEAVTTRPGTRSRTRRDLGVVLAAAVAGAATWSVWTVFGADLVVDVGSGRREIGALAVVVTSLGVAAAAAVLLRLMEAGLAAGQRWWSIIAVAVWALSMLGPLAATSAEAFAALVSLHVVVGMVVFLGLLRPARS